MKNFGKRNQENLQMAEAANNDQLVQDVFLGSGYWIAAEGQGSPEAIHNDEADEREKAPIKRPAPGENPPYYLTTNSSMVCIETPYVIDGVPMIQYGTGFFIDDPKFPNEIPDGSGGKNGRKKQSRFILTAAHVVMQNKELVERISINVPNPEIYDKDQVLPGRAAAMADGRFRRYDIEVVKDVNVFVHPSYENGPRGRKVDIALIVLDKPVESVMNDIGSVDSGVTVADVIRTNVTGYPGDDDKSYVLYMSNSHYYDEETGEMVKNDPEREVKEFEFFNDEEGSEFGKVYYTNQTTKGQSGGRVTMLLNGEDEEKVYAVHSFGSLKKPLNCGALITKAVYKWIRDHQNSIA